MTAFESKQAKRVSRNKVIRRKRKKVIKRTHKQGEQKDAGIKKGRRG